MTAALLIAFGVAVSVGAGSVQAIGVGSTVSAVSEPAPPVLAPLDERWG
ncbi:hypothetical protein J7F03_04815 [Streptomyces sp. ISL-43]|nr:hypothetical protein [Streptomyces sp. ISL-43]MBT2446416.1 hypothetical protein [Streptomyces sp. ISL-43]